MNNINLCEDCIYDGNVNDECLNCQVNDHFKRSDVEYPAKQKKELTITVKLCPFCGGEPRIDFHNVVNVVGRTCVNIICSDCGCIVSHGYVVKYSNEKMDTNFCYSHSALLDTVDKWNRRV